jgi:glycosyltransferase involved in cell wall biosynthesis
MRIAIDVSPVVYGTGVSVYTKNLVENILSLSSSEEVVVFGGSLRRFDKLRLFGENVSKIREIDIKFYHFPPSLMDLVWNRLHILPVECFVGDIDVFHSSDWTQPPSKAFKVTTIHDLSPILFPDLTHPRIVSVHRRRIDLVLRECDAVIVPSETTARDLASMGYKKKMIRVIPEAPDPSFKSTSPFKIEEAKKKFNINGEYLISIGVNKRKNTQRIIEAFKLLRKLGIEKQLVIVGQSLDDFPQVDGVIFTGHIGQEEMVCLMSGSSALVYPSLYEGFGLPILEAYACGIPVVTSNVGSMKELGRDASVLVDPTKSTSIANGIAKALKERNKLVKYGKKVLNNYSWRKTALMTLEVYKELV